MVDLKKAKENKKIKNPTKLVSCRIDYRYLVKLRKQGVSFTEFTKQGFKETFGELD